MAGGGRVKIKWGLVLISVMILRGEGGPRVSDPFSWVKPPCGRSREQRSDVATDTICRAQCQRSRTGITYDAVCVPFCDGLYGCGDNFVRIDAQLLVHMLGKIEGRGPGRGPATNSLQTNCSRLSRRLKDKGVDAVEIFRSEFRSNSAQFLGERIKSKRALLSRLRNELEGIPTEGNTDVLLACVRDGTYPSPKAGPPATPGKTTGETDGGYSSDEETESDHSSDGDESNGGTLAAEEPKQDGSGSNEVSGQGGELRALRRDLRENNQQSFKLLASLREDQFSLREFIKKLKKKQKKRAKDLFEDVERARKGGTSNGLTDTDSDEDSSNEERSVKYDERRLKKSNALFFAKFAKRPFPDPTMLVDSFEGPNMLRKALTNYPTVTPSVDSRQLIGSRNKREAVTLAKAVDCLISYLGVLRAKDELAVELLMRRLAAVNIADKTNSWDAARELDEDVDNLLSKTHRRKLHKSAKLRKELSSKNDKSDLSKEQGNAGE
ncbi:hypothetical protein FGB62_122g059 [Gracilaria domingensis]|nr:hypothetical protein FGB62_122g059 [Gracilaria domingensis]